MTVKQGTPNPFRRVQIKPRLKSRLQQPSGATVYPTGRTKFNTASSEKFRVHAKAQGLDPETCAVQYGVDDHAGVVSIYLVDAKTANSAAVRWSKDKTSVTLYMVDVFDESPDLRPSGKRQCSVSDGADPAGDPCLFLSLHVSLEKRTAPSKKETSAAK